MKIIRNNDFQKDGQQNVVSQFYHDVHLWSHHRITGNLLPRFIGCTFIDCVITANTNIWFEDCVLSNCAIHTNDMTLLLNCVSPDVIHFDGEKSGGLKFGSYETVTCDAGTPLIAKWTHIKNIEMGWGDLTLTDLTCDNITSTASGPSLNTKYLIYDVIYRGRVICEPQREWWAS